MHQTDGQRNRETAAFLAMCLSYGSRKQFMPKIAELLGMSGGKPYDWIVSGGYKTGIKPSPQCFYRFYTYSDIHHLLTALHLFFSEYASLGSFAKAAAAQTSCGRTDVESVLVALHLSLQAAMHVPVLDGARQLSRRFGAVEYLHRQGQPVYSP